jgi:hypothetical protein
MMLSSRRPGKIPPATTASARGDGAGDRVSVTHVSAEDCDPFHSRCTERTSRLVGTPDCDAHSRSLGSEVPHETLAQETRAAEYADRGHGIPPRMLDRVDRYRKDAAQKALLRPRERHRTRRS